MIAFGLVAKFLLLLGLIKLLRETNNPYMCAGIYVFVTLFFNLLIGHSLGELFFGAIITGALATLYFWLLDKFEGAGFIFWVIAIGGLVVGLV